MFCSEVFAIAGVQRHCPEGLRHVDKEEDNIRGLPDIRPDGRTTGGCEGPCRIF